MVSVLVIEDHVVFGRALVRLLTEKANVDVADVVRSGEEALEKLQTQKSHSHSACFHEQFPDLLCLMLSGHLTPFYVQRSLEAGARGYVLKDDIAGVIEGVGRVLEGEIYISNALRDP